MKKQHIGSLSQVAAAAIIATGLTAGKVYAKTRDVAYTYRAPAGFAGDINRAHPFSVEPALPNAANPPLLYGDAVMVDSATNSVRQILSTDTAVIRIYGIVSRDYPTQQTTGGMSTTPGTQVPPTNRALSIMRWGYAMVRVNGTPRKNDPVFLWVAASTGNHVQGTFETAASAGNTAALTNCTFNGPPDANGICEIVVDRAPAV
jgi:hypothetical protein